MRNFLSVGDEPVEINFPDKCGITLIQGQNLDVSQKSSNGAGKSTIIEGILFALYGQTLRKLKKEEYYINDKAENDCIVELEYDNVKIVRKFPISKRGTKGQGKVEFYLDGKRQSTDASTPKVKEDIQNHIRISFETMCNILIFGQHNMVSFLEAGESDKRDIVESLMNLREYNGYEERARKEHRETETKLKVLSGTYTQLMQHIGEQIALRYEQEKKHRLYIEKLDEEIAQIQARLEAIPNMEALRKDWEVYNATETQKQEYKDNIATHTTWKNATQAELNEIIAKKQKEAEGKQPLIAASNALVAKRQVLDARKKEREDAELGPIQVEVNNVCAELEAKHSVCKAAADQVQPAENWNALISTAAKQVSDAEKSVEVLRSKKLTHDETCPECFGKIDINNCENVIIKREAELADLQDKLNQLIAQKKADNERIDEAKLRYKAEYESYYEVWTVRREVLRVKYAAVADEIGVAYNGACEKLKGMIAAQQKQISDFDSLLNAKFDFEIERRETKIKNLMAEVGAVQRELYRIQNATKPSITLEELATIQANAENDRKALKEKKAGRKINPFGEIIESLNANIAELDKKVKTAEQAVKNCENSVPYLKFWVTAFGKEGIKSYIIDQIVPTLNEQIEYWMQLVYQGAISVTFDKLLNVTMVNNASQNEMIFGQGSGGERRRIDIAIMLAFRQIMKLSTGHDPNVVFFDEVAENLDEEGVMRLHEALEDIARTSRVYVITHNPALLGLLSGAEKLTVRKKGGVMSLAN